MKLFGLILFLAGASLITWSLWLAWRPLAPAFGGAVLIYLARFAFADKV